MALETAFKNIMTYGASLITLTSYKTMGANTGTRCRFIL
jgi:hypothetical protein